VWRKAWLEMLGRFRPLRQENYQRSQWRVTIPSEVCASAELSVLLPLKAKAEVSAC